ncbi:MAG: helix-turn-helix domain-containing protein [Candidatus Latescibacterota bacterium]
MWRELVFPPGSAADPVLVIADDRAQVLADPLRWRILGTLGEGRSVGELSRLLAVTDARILYHLERLVQAGAVELHRDEADPRAWRCAPAACSIRVRLPPSADDEATGGIPSGVVIQFNQALREAAEGLYGPTFQVSLNHNRARLSEEQASEFSRRLLALIEEYFPPGRGDRSGTKYGFYAVLTPIDVHPLGDARPEPERGAGPGGS